MLGIAGLAVALSMAAEPDAYERVSLEWRGPSTCDEGPRAQQRARDLLRGSTESRPARASVDVASDGAEWIATVNVSIADERLTRTFRGAPCSTLVEAVALVVAVTIDPLATSVVLLEPADSSDENVEPLVPPPPRRVAREPTEVVPRRRVAEPSIGPEPGATHSQTPRGLTVAGHVEGGGTVGLLPVPSGRLGGGVAVGYGAARIGIAAAHVFARTIEHPARRTVGADVALSFARASACWSPMAGRFTIPMCAGIEAGAFVASGIGLERRGTARSAWAAVVPELRPSVWPTRRFGISLVVEAPIALVRPRFGVDDFEADLMRVDQVGVRFGLALEVIFFDRTAGSRRTNSGNE